MRSIPTLVFYGFNFSRCAALFCCLAFFLYLSGCGSDETTGTPASTSSKSASEQARTQPSQSPVKETTSQALHESAVELFALGISGDDPSAVMQATSLFEQAVAADPDNTAYWIDLADAYMLSDIPGQYPYAIDIYWILLKEKDSQQDILLGRLADAYFKTGQTQLAFDASMKRLELAQDDRVELAAYSLAYMALANRSFVPAVNALKTKAGSHQNPTYLLLVASLLEDASGNPAGAVELINKALQKGQDGSPLAQLAENERRRIQQ